MATLIGNSGFEYIIGGKKKIGGSKKRGFHYGSIVTIKNIKTDNILFTLMGGIRYKPYSTPFTEDRKFLGLDNKYYYIIAKSNYTVDWGQIQSDGAVLRANRTILKTIAFFPHYKEPATTVPTVTPIIIKEPPNVPKVVVIPPAPVKTPVAKEVSIKKEDVSWIQKIINWIIAILNR